MAIASIARRVEMGGLGGEVRGATQEEAWTKFDKSIRSQVEDEFGLFLDAPLTREAAYKKMWKDNKSESWVLDYYFSK
jgi:hypothetical protein